MAEDGGRLVDADRIGHEVLEMPEIKRGLRRAFGDEVFAAMGTVSREALGRAVFGREERLKELNAIVHPVILDIMEHRIREASEAGEAQFVVLDAALLMEKDLHKAWCDTLVFVDAEEGDRQERARRQRGWDARQLSQRDAAQDPPEAKRQIADFVIDNSGTRRQLEDGVRALMGQIRTKFSLATRHR
jgi:dephospho-CoA kinase